MIIYILIIWLKYDFKDSKQLSNYVEKVMDSDSNDSSADEENTVYEEFVPD